MNADLPPELPETDREAIGRFTNLILAIACLGAVVVGASRYAMA